MKCLIIHAPFLPVAGMGMALFPFVLLKEQQLKGNPEIINHERIHLKQQLELLILPFYTLYLINYLLNLIYYRNHELAYQNIVFEREAYHHEHDLAYLNQRSFWAWKSFW